MPLDEAFFHQPSDSVRFWVEIAGIPVGSSVGRHTLHYRYQPQRSDDDPLETYRANEAEIHAAVRRRVAGGSIEPVMLRDPDLAPPRPAP
jgi:hypothetical protein